MTQISRLLAFGLSLLMLTCTAFAQERERPNRPNNRQGANLSPEEWKQQQQEAINRKTQQFMKKMDDLVAEDKKPGLQRIVQIYLVEELKIRMEMMAGRNKAQGNRQAMAQLTKTAQEKTVKLKSQAQDAANKLFDDKKTLNAFKKNLNAMSPDRAPGGGGQGGQGGRSGGGGGGQGG